MEKNSSTFNSKKLPIAFIASVIIFILIQSILIQSEGFWKFCYRYSQLPEDGPVRVEGTLRTLETKADQNNVFFVGSSQTQEGFDVEYLEDLLRKKDMKFYNLGMAGTASAIDLYMQKDQVFAKNPKIIVYNPFVESFFLEYKDSKYNRMEHFFQPNIAFYIYKHLGWEGVTRHSKDLFQSLLGRLSTLYKHRSQISSIIFHSIRVKLGLEEHDGPVKYQYSERRPPEYFDKLLSQAKKDRYIRNEYTKLNEELFSKFIKEAKQRNVRVIVMTTPVNPLMKQTYDITYDQYLTDLLVKIAMKEDIEFFDESDLPEFKDEDFIDLMHLNSYGRAKLSTFLYEYLQRDHFKEKILNVADELQKTEEKVQKDSYIDLVKSEISSEQVTNNN